MPQANEGSSDQSTDKRKSRVFERIAGRLRRIFLGHRAHSIPSNFTGTYTDAAFHFSFNYPPDLRLQSWQDGAATTIRARDAGKRIGFQISIRPIDGTDTAITPSRLARDMPGLSVRKPEAVRIRGAGRALAFYATEHTFGDSFQAWFIRDGHLFQISSYAPHAALIRGVLASWTFTK